ncbi:ORC ubiquitin ligase 1 isoform X1 [Dicentrarchus labrax]|uniref:RING-type domain-containing protein n=2 Tax=Dicentrarchus labrax TaxID=13489 RepID=A0A8C4GPT3_DICLA|nr:ORC ubiquitin ligase 1 isoform X1 [Dicentrarchus labrax]
MALNYQTSTLSLTLPISCQICLGKVKQPVICGNHHVFCSSCMEMWLKKASQCPTCRVPITAENPCREILGGTNESDHSDSPSMRKYLRKTRGELLLREYEEEIEGLIRENEELKTKNLSLESQLKTALDPCSINTVQTDDKKVDPLVLEEWTNKLRAATDVCDKVKQDMDKLKEANKALRSQNVDLVQENMRLKAEVASRSPQKFGRYTVAALEAKIQQYERDVDHLKRALERSDQYIEDLESRVSKPEKRSLDVQEACGSGKAGSEAFTQQQKINMMMRSLSDNERVSICSNPEAECRTFSRNHSLMFMPSADHKQLNKNLTEDQKNEDLESTSSDLLPTTPSSAFRSLTLRSPGIREKKVAFKPVSYLRRLDFEEFPCPGKSSSTMENQFSSLDKFPKCSPPNTDTEPSKSAFWGGWQRSTSDDQSCPSPNKESPVKGAASTDLVGDKPDSFHMSSEASMDAAYLDKISELDSMMLDGESSSSRGSQLSLASSPPADLDNTLVSEPQTCPDVSSSHGGKPVIQCDQKSHLPCKNTDDTLTDKEAPKESAEESFASLESGSEGSAHDPDCAELGGSSQTDELSFDLLFDSLEENKAGPSGSVSPASQDNDRVNPSFSSSSSTSCTSKPVNTTRERHALNISQPTKRKSHSPFNTSSPTKLSKLM